MAKFENYHDLDAAQVLAPQDTGTGTANGNSVDLNPQDGTAHAESLLLTFSTAAPSTGADISFTVQESSDNSNWSDVDSSDLEDSAPNYTDSDSARVDEVAYTGEERYVRVNYDASGGSAGAVVSVNAHRGHLDEAGKTLTA